MFYFSAFSKTDRKSFCIYDYHRQSLFLQFVLIIQRKN